MKILTIDGSYGEGGGQILRTSLALSLITKKPFNIVNIRAKRANPGLRAQHLTCVKAAQKISEAEVKGAEIGSLNLTFYPAKVKAGKYKFEVKSAGSTGLVLQSLYLPLALSTEKSNLTILGGTHVPWSPCFHYTHYVFSPVVFFLGIIIKLELIRWGFYPKGGGCIKVTIEPTDEIRGIDLSFSFSPEWIKVISASANLPNHVRKRQLNQAIKRLEQKGLQAQGEIEEAKSLSPGSVVFILSRCLHSRVGFTSLGEKGKPSEKVADEAVDDFISFLETKACIEEHLADQLLLPLSLAKEKSSIFVSRMSQHILTNMWVIQQFLDVEFKTKKKNNGFLIEVIPF